MNETLTEVTVSNTDDRGVWIGGLGGTDPRTLFAIESLLSVEGDPHESISWNCLIRNNVEWPRDVMGIQIDPEGAGNLRQPLDLTPNRAVFFGGFRGATHVLNFGPAEAIGARLAEHCTLQSLTEPLLDFRSLGSYGLLARNVFLGEGSLATQAVSTTVPSRSQSAEARFRSVFQRAREERFEDGMESEFSKELESLVRACGPSSQEMLATLLEDDGLSKRVWGEAMRSLGRIDDPGSHLARLWMLEKGLTSSSALVRDGATLGLASMDDRRAVPYLQRAIDVESIAGLRGDMQEVLSHLARQ
jgi:hypothetical protein